jgi:F-type H+-transporting ATPase subunit delta
VATDDPISEGMAGRYAAALFELANEQEKLSEIENDLALFQKMLDDSADLKALVKSPVVSREDQGKALAALVAKAGMGGTTGNFLQLIAKNGRLFAVEDMMKAFRALAARQRGEMQAEVTSAVPLGEAQIAELKSVLKAAVGKDVMLSPRVDPAILGGLVVKLGSRMIDSSLRTKLAGLRVAMKG